MNDRKRDCFLLLELLLLPVLVIGVQDHSAQPTVVMTGSNVILKTSMNRLGHYKRLTWLYTNKQKILEHSNEIKYFNTKFKDRVMLDLETGALHLYDVRRMDSGDYYLRVVYKERENESKITLKVFDPVPKPVITFEMRKESSNSCYLKLSCTVKDQDVDYVWYKDSGPFSKENKSDMLEITVNPQNYSTFYTCQVSNPVSSKNDTMYFTPPCVLARSAGVTWIATWLVPLTPIILYSLLT